MKPRRVYIGLEVETDATIKTLRQTLPYGIIPAGTFVKQVQINVMQGVRSKQRPRQKKRSRS